MLHLVCLAHSLTALLSAVEDGIGKTNMGNVNRNFIVMDIAVPVGCSNSIYTPLSLFFNACGLCHFDIVTTSMKVKLNL